MKICSFLLILIGFNKGPKKAINDFGRFYKKGIPSTMSLCIKKASSIARLAGNSFKKCLLSKIYLFSYLIAFFSFFVKEMDSPYSLFSLLNICNF